MLKYAENVYSMGVGGQNRAKLGLLVFDNPFSSRGWNNFRSNLETKFLNNLKSHFIDARLPDTPLLGRPYLLTDSGV